MLTLNFKIEKFDSEDVSGFFHNFDKAQVVQKSLDKVYLKRLIEILSSRNLLEDKGLNFEGDILLNNLSFKREKIVRNYIQKHSLFLTDFYYQTEFTVLENVKLFSMFWNKRELESSVLASFFLENVKNEVVKNLNHQQKLMLNLSKLVACPAYMWFIDKKLIKDLNEENLYIFNNIINIRIKQGGICLILEAI